MSPATIVGFLVILFLLIASALISGSEVAYFSLGPKENSVLNKKNKPNARRILTLMKRPEHLLATVLITNNLVNVGIVILSTWVIKSMIKFDSQPILGFIVQTIIITFVILLIGEIIPKVYATRYALRFAQMMALPITVLEVIWRPLSNLLIRSTNLVSKRLKDQPPDISMDDLSQALELTGEELKEDEQILKGIVKFGNIDVKEIMCPRVDMIALDIKTTFADLLDTLINSGFSRIPIYVANLDHIKGILFVKDLLPHIHKGQNFRWQSLIRPPYYVPENKKINDLLGEFQQNKVHLAVVVDEYGGTSGLITLEDILEEIVGEISDESDLEETFYSKISDNSFLFTGKTSLLDLIKVLELPDDFFDEIKGESETLAGMILESKGELPAKGERIEFRDYSFIVRNSDDRRIKEIMVMLPHPKSGDV